MRAAAVEQPRREREREGTREWAAAAAAAAAQADTAVSVRLCGRCARLQKVAAAASGAVQAVLHRHALEPLAAGGYCYSAAQLSDYGLCCRRCSMRRQPSGQLLPRPRARDLVVLLLLLLLAVVPGLAGEPRPGSSADRDDEEVVAAAPRHQQNQRPSFIERRLREHESSSPPAEAQQGPSAQIRHGRSRGRLGARGGGGGSGNRAPKSRPAPEPEQQPEPEYQTFSFPELLLLQPADRLQLAEWNASAADYYEAGGGLELMAEVDANATSERPPGPGSPTAAVAIGSGQVDIVTRFLRIIENQHLLGENCTAGTDLNLGEGVVDQYAQERFRLEANLAVNRANMLTRLWKYAPEVMTSSEYLLHASVLSMVEFDEDIFAAGNCYDKLQYKERWLYCPFAHRLQDDDGILVKDLAVEYKYLSNSSEWFYRARKNAERRIASYNQFSRGYHTYTHNDSSHTERMEDEILTVRYEDGRWSKPYYDCGGGNIWMLTYTVPFFGYANDTYYFKGTSGIDIDLRRVDIDQCPLPPGSMQLNIFAASDKCKKRTTECVAISGLGFRRGSYRCVCKRGFYYPDTKSTKRYYNGTVIEEEYEKLMMGRESQYSVIGVFECLPCAEGCESCEDDSPCVVSLNWLMRTAILILECCVIACLPVVVFFTWKYGNVKVVRAASPVLLRVIVLGAFFIYCTTIVMYPQPNIITCTVRVWLREIGFSLTYGALMLKTWRISVIFRVRSAKAVKITDGNLLKRLGIIVTIFSVFLGIRTLVAPPVVIVGRTADDLKAYLCRTDWWDHSFTILEVMFLVWGIRLCIVVRKAPSEFNESRFISMAIYNEFLLSVFLNVSMLFLQSPANPDLLYIIFFCHTQLTVTLLLGLIFGSKAYVVFRGGGKDDTNGKLAGTTSKFLGKTCRAPATSNQTNSISLHQANLTEDSDGMMEEFRRLYTQLELLKEKNARLGNRQLFEKIVAMQEAANRVETQVSTIHPISWSLQEKESSKDSSLSIRRKTEVTKCIDCSHNEQRNVIISDSNKASDGDAQKEKDKKAESEKDEDKSKSKEESICSDKDKKKDGDKGENTTNVKTQELLITKNIDEQSKDRNRNKSGHARTHAIVINLDDKSRFSEEVTV